ncbi:hypothetical protein BGX28_008221 [Mortierella sp. GBA30]|nr:hypothetical protein BGX28_008221 [Mortierella sp. GBA30]
MPGILSPCFRHREIHHRLGIDTGSLQQQNVSEDFDLLSHSRPNHTATTATDESYIIQPNSDDLSNDAEDIDLEIDLDGVHTAGYTTTTTVPEIESERRNRSGAFKSTTISTSTTSGSLTSSSSSFPATPSDMMDPDQQQRRELMMLKREAFQELASQTQRFDDLFIAKMIYWESLGLEEKAQWLERGRRQDHHHSQEFTPIEREKDNCEMDQDEIDELVHALECRATVKDYSALIAFERQAELEKKRKKEEKERRRREDSTVGGSHDYTG